MSEEKPDVNVYGHNLPADRGESKPGIRERSTEQELDHAREKHSVEGGGMGRPEVPKDEPGPGQYYHDDSAVKHAQALDEHPELEDTPMPPRNAPLSDEVPS